MDYKSTTEFVPLENLDTGNRKVNFMIDGKAEMYVFRKRWHQLNLQYKRQWFQAVMQLGYIRVAIFGTV